MKSIQSYQGRISGKEQEGEGVPIPGTETSLISTLSARGVCGLGAVVLGGALLALILLRFLDRPFTGRVGRYQTTHSFGTPGTLSFPTAGTLVSGKDGALYGTTAFNRDAVFRFSPEDRQLTVLHAFSGSGEDGCAVGAGLVLAPDGILVGTTSGGGSLGAGTVFRLNEDGSGFGILHSFGSVPADGVAPMGSLVIGPDGGAYGTTYSGGRFGAGIVFRLALDGSSYSILHQFGQTPEAPWHPHSGLIIGPDGALYGTTATGGDGGAGCVFRLDDRGEFSVLHWFGETEADGRTPYGSLVLVGETSLYGTASGGGKYNLGTVFRVDIEGTEYRTVHDFNGRDGAFPQSELVGGPDGWIYGTTPRGGEMDGTLYKLDPDSGNLEILHKFGGSEKDGTNPDAGVVVSRGVLYGITKAGGGAGQGTLFSFQIQKSRRL